MAVRVKQHAVLLPIRSPIYPTYDMVIVPSREFGNLLATDGTETVLLFPEVNELPFPLQVVCHLDA